MSEIALESYEVKKLFHKNKALKYQASYVNGELNGPCQAWFEDGKTSFKGNWEKNKRHGVWEDFDENGNVSHRYWFKGKEVKFNDKYIELMRAFIENANHNISSHKSNLTPKMN